MTPEEQAKFDGLDPTQQSVTAILMTLLEVHSGAEATDKSLNPNVAIEACLMIVSALMEIDSRNEATRDLRVSIDRAAEVMRKMTKRMRADFEATGKRGIEMMGASDVRTTRLN